MKIGLIGAGRIGKLHGELLTYHISEAEIKTVADIYRGNVEQWAKQLNILSVTTDYKNILNDSEIEAVLICSSTDTHAQLIVEAAQAGKHIFCEKPIDFNTTCLMNYCRISEESRMFRLNSKVKFPCTMAVQSTMMD